MFLQKLVIYFTIFVFTPIITTGSRVKPKKPIVCVNFDSQMCKRNKSDCMYRNVTCDADIDHCMAVFQHPSLLPNRKYDLLYLKCWPKWELKSCPIEGKDCIQVISKSFEKDFHPTKRNVAHCCCKGSHCNDPNTLNFVKIERPPPPTNTPMPVEESPKKDNRQSGVMYTAVIILVPLVAVCIVIVFSYWLWRRFYCCRSLGSKSGHNMLLTAGLSGGATDETSLLSPGAVGPDGYKPGVLIAQCKLVEIRSRGRYGCVWLSKMHGWPNNKEDTEEREVAVKVFPPQDRQSWLTEQEIYRLRGLQHPNILKYIGSDQYGENVVAQLWIVTEYHPIGSVADFLRTNTVEYAQLLSILRTIAEGMRHLHEELIPNKPSIAHRDFKSKNVLLKANLREACIADMGLALKFEMGQRVGDTHGQVGTRRYMAPEVLEGAIQFSRDAFLRIDTYAMALVMWELMTRCNFLDAYPPAEAEHAPRAGGAAPDAPEEAAAAEEAEEEEEETDEGLAMLEDDSSQRSSPNQSPGGRRAPTSGAAPVYQLPFEVELGSQPSLEAMQEFVVQRKLRPKMRPDWRQHEGMARLWETLEECWDQDAEARLSAGLVMVRMQGLEAKLPAHHRLPALPPASGIGPHLPPRRRRDSSSSALGSSASSLHPAASQVAPPNAELQALA